MSDETEIYPTPMVYGLDPLIRAIDNLIDAIPEGWFANQIKILDELIPNGDVDRMIIAELPESNGEGRHGPTWKVDGATVIIDFGAEIRIRGFPHSIDDPRAVALALLAADTLKNRQ